ncbi:ArsR/SmtB family transcription factor [Streptomyces flaveolus]|uniref:ArsR/SmtB family transcription factor n=1 Tax=Streptomyces flaveolus TaxID=67297 RepID=UPI0036FA5987
MADTARRDIPRRCVRDELAVSRLAEACPMSFAAVQKHVAVLEGAGLVTKQRRGREQLVRTDPAAVDRARQALDGLETAWRGRADGFADQDGAPHTTMPTIAVRVRLDEHGGGTRMEMRSVFDSAEQMEQLADMGMVEGLRQAVGQMDGLLAD